MLERLLTLALLLAFAGCDSSIPSAPHAPPAPPPAPTSAAPANTAPVAAPTPPAPVANSAPAAGSEQAAAQLAQAMTTISQTMTAMRDAAKQAGGDGVCEHAYRSRLAAEATRQRMLDSSALTARAPRPRWVIAPHDRYVALCEALPEPVRACAAFERYQDGHDECEQRAAALSPPLRSAWRELFHEEPAATQ